MIKKILLMAVTLIGLQAEELSKEYPIVNGYIQQYKGDRSLSESKKLLKEQCFINANKFIYDDDKKVEMVFDIKKSDVLKGMKNKKVKIANFNKALESLESCVKQTKNPIAAWEGMYIINSYFGLNNKENIATYKILSKVLYKDKSCDGYISQGKLYDEGYGVKPNKKKALKIYTEGTKRCTSTWHKIIFEMKINNIKSRK